MYTSPVRHKLALPLCAGCGDHQAGGWYAGSNPSQRALLENLHLRFCAMKNGIVKRGGPFCVQGAVIIKQENDTPAPAPAKEARTFQKEEEEVGI
jgi:hypothetical protein